MAPRKINYISEYLRVWFLWEKIAACASMHTHTHTQYLNRLRTRENLKVKKQQYNYMLELMVSVVRDKEYGYNRNEF